MPGQTMVAYKCRTRPHTLSKPKLATQTNPLSDWKAELSPWPCIHPFFIPLFSWCHPCHWHITMWCSDDIMHNSLNHHITMWCSDDVMLFLVGNPCACILALEWQFLAQSMSVGAPMLTILTWRLIVTPGTYHDNLLQVPQCTPHQSCQDVIYY